MGRLSPAAARRTGRSAGLPTNGSYQLSSWPDGHGQERSFRTAPKTRPPRTGESRCSAASGCRFVQPCRAAFGLA